MTKPLPFTEASIRRLVKAARKSGLRVVGIRADGTVIVQDGDGATAGLPSPEARGEIAPQSSKWEDAGV